MASVLCGFTGKAHLFEHCTCGDSKCRRWVCIGCDHWIDRARGEAR